MTKILNFCVVMNFFLSLLERSNSFKSFYKTYEVDLTQQAAPQQVLQAEVSNP